MTTLEQAVTEDCHAIVDWLCDSVVEGVFPLSSARALAYEYLLDQDLPCRDSKADALVRQETSRHFTAGFLRGFGERVRPPVPVPAPLAAAWVVEARIAAAVAVIYGHAVDHPRIQAEVMASLLGDAASRLVAQALGVDPAAPQVSLDDMITRLSHGALAQVTDMVGASLLGKLDSTPARSRALDQILIPGQGVDEVLDATACYITGRTAISIFRRGCTDDPTAGAGARLTYWEPPS